MNSQPESCSKCSGSKLTQEEDVLDTWFSSALWPFATMGWPEKTPELEYFYPTDVLVTSREIIYLWVARMIFSSLEYLDGEIPFKDVYIYATVLNEEGKRMSKSLGTGVDPLYLIDSYGADALRFALIQQTGKNQDLRFSDKRVEIVRNFCNKIWNASRFVIMNLEGFDHTKSINKDLLTLQDKWILSRLQKLSEAVNKGFSNYDMDDSARAIYEFIWNEYCDWYLEMAKSTLQDETRKENVQCVLYTVLESTLKILHPIMPFITEEIWQVLPHNGNSIMISNFPERNEEYIDEASENEMQVIMDVVRNIRNLRAELNVSPGKKIDVIYSADAPNKEKIEKNISSIMSLAKVENMKFADKVDSEDKNKYVSSHMPGIDLYVEVAGLVDLDKEKARIDNELKSIEKELQRVEGKLNNEKFLSKAPADIVEKEKRIAAELNETKKKLLEKKTALGI
ncbi:MAG: class I tRNA ligase family protein [Armatimonadota bacterium]